ncbi:MAG: indolepyruvate oxidoreductase, partial [Sphingobacteriia bacterium]|nr:indolepyruvate oxidoreductase [Sphingobacteriia bacterium]
AKDLGSERSANMVILGAASPYLQMDFEALENAVSEVFAKKGDDIVAINLACLNAGRTYAMQQLR